MKLHLSDKYTGDKKRNFAFPSDGIPQKMKNDKKYFLQAAQAIITKFVNNFCEIPYSAFDGRESMQTLIDYAQGKQGSDKYKNYLIGNIQKETGCRPQSTINIDWRPLDILPKKLGDVKGYMQKLKYDIVTSAIDPQAMFSKDMVKAATKLASNDLMRTLHQEINELAGGMAVNPEGQLMEQSANAVQFQSADQVDSFAAIGGFQLLQEIAMKLLLDKTEYDSISDVLDDMTIDSLITLGISAKKYYCEEGSDDVLRDHVDVRNAIIPYSKYPDFRDASYFGDIERISIAQLRKTSDLSEKEIIDIAKKFNDASFNSQYSIKQDFFHVVNESRENGLGLAVLDSIMVDVANVVWLGTKTTKLTSMKREKEGNLALNKVDDDYELNERSKRKGKSLEEYTTQVIYKAKLIIGTDYIFDYGQLENVDYKKNSKGKMSPVFPYTFYKISGPSLVEKCIGLVDDANMALFKKRIIIKNMPTGPNIRIKKSAFENVKIDGKLQRPSDLMALYRDEGFLIEDDQNPWGNQSNSGRAIDVIPTDITQRLIECRNELEWNMRMIEEITGLNAVFSASTPSSETGLGVSKIAVSATENSIYTIISAYEKFKENGYKVNTHLWRMKAFHMDDKKRDNFATDRSLNYIRIGKEIGTHEYNTKIEVGVTEDEKLLLQQKVTQLTDFRRQAGEGGIKPSDELMMFELIKSGNIKLARMVLAQIEEQRKAEDEAIAEKRYQENAKLQQESNQQASENKKQELEMEGQIKADIEMKKIQAQIMLQDKKAADERKLSASQNVYGWGLEKYRQTVKHK